MELDAKFDPKAIEKAAHPTLKSRNTRGRIAMIEGPPTMNGIPHIGHLRGRVIKDMWYRYKTLQGYDVSYSAGWDAQGLPVELQAQKELGIEGSKSKIQERGIEELVTECKRIVKSYNEKWVTVDRMMGMSADQDSAYWTYRDAFIEREWQILRRAQELGVLQDSYTVIAYCPKCQTSLSHAEVSQGYKEVRDPSLYYKVKLQDEDAYLVVWTTMPFTLVTDALVGVHPNEEYCRIRVNDEIWLVGKTRLEEFAQDARIEKYDVMSSVKGAELDGKKYVHPLLDVIPALAKLAESPAYHSIVAEDYVDTSAGSGLVHISPANGEDDIRIARKRDIDVFNPINDEVVFTEEAGKYAGSFVRDTDSTIVDDLRERGALVRISKIRHKYPHCWRSGDALVWLARRGWFYMIDRLDNMTIDAASAVEYYYEQTRNRFLGIVSEKHPWCISRERFWGTPLPVWSCDECGHKTWLYSRAEIIDAADNLPEGEDFELHMPWIDRVTVRCAKCKSTKTSREKYVLDTWHNSGSAPHSSLDDEVYSECVPVPFLSEGIDQTRGWAYTLLVENVILQGAPRAPYSSFLFQGHVLDKDGNKMSKSEGNVIDAHDLLTRHPADLVRFYFMWKSSPIEALSFDEKELVARPYQVLGTLYNIHSYFVQNSSYDSFDVSSSPDTADMLPADSWILSRLQYAIKGVTQNLDSCHIHEAARAIENFVINEFSQVYIPMIRTELWDENKKKRHHAIYAVIAHILRNVDILLHPFCPFTTSYLYEHVFESSMSDAEWPQYSESHVNEPLEETFALILDAVSVASAARAQANLKRRWPLESMTLVVDGTKKDALEQMSGILKEQLNVESVDIRGADVSLTGIKRARELESFGLPLCARATLDRKAAGPKAKRLLPKLVTEFANTNDADIISKLEATGKFNIVIDGTDIALDDNDMAIDTIATGDNVMSDRAGLAVIMSSTRSDRMVCKGLVRDLARRLQSLRKERGYNPTDVLEYASVSGLDADQVSMLESSLEEIAFLVRVNRVVLGDVSGAEYADADVDGQSIRLAVHA